MVDTCVASDQCGSSPHCSLLKSITQTRCRQLAACGGVKQALTRAHTRAHTRTHARVKNSVNLSLVPQRTLFYSLKKSETNSFSLKILSPKIVFISDCRAPGRSRCNQSPPTRASPPDQASVCALSRSRSEMWVNPTAATARGTCVFFFCGDFCFMRR